MLVFGVRTKEVGKTYRSYLFRPDPELADVQAPATQAVLSEESSVLVAAAAAVAGLRVLFGVEPVQQIPARADDSQSQDGQHVAHSAAPGAEAGEAHE